MSVDTLTAIFNTYFPYMLYRFHFDNNDWSFVNRNLNPLGVNNIEHDFYKFYFKYSITTNIDNEKIKRIREFVNLNNFDKDKILLFDKKTDPLLNNENLKRYLRILCFLITNKVNYFYGIEYSSKDIHQQPFDLNTLFNYNTDYLILDPNKTIIKPVIIQL